jgi:3-oxoacyl-[acyl-carrier-protein] synthase II
MGLITPLGIGIEETWAALCAGKSGITKITRFDASPHQTQIAAEVKGFKAEDFMPKKDAKRNELFISYAMAATRLALEDAGLEIDSGNMAPGMISIHFGAIGPNLSIATACAAGAHAIGDSFKMVQSGMADAMITGGTEAVVSATAVAGFNAMKALSTRNDEPEKASRPFDRDRDGFVIGEGSGILILEALDYALERGAKIYAEIVGFGLTGDGYHITSPCPDGDGAVRCMQAAIDDAGIGYENVDYINAHGTSTELNDLYESRAVKTVFKDYAYKVAISSTKSMTGHLLGGAGGIETVFTALSVYHDMIPPTINYENQAEECDLDYVPNTARQAPVKVAMTNSFGFGGTNATLILKKYTDQ